MTMNMPAADMLGRQYVGRIPGDGFLREGLATPASGLLLQYSCCCGGDTVNSTGCCLSPPKGETPVLLKALLPEASFAKTCQCLLNSPMHFVTRSKNQILIAE